MPKLTTLDRAVGDAVKPGSSIYITGFTHLINFAAARELIRQGVRGLTLIRLTPDVIYDQLVAAGCADHLVFSYLGNPGVGALKAIRRAIESGALSWEEYTHGALIAAIRAAAANAPFAVVAPLGRTGLAESNSRVAMIRSPFDGQQVAVVPPVRPDVAIVHVQRADADGNGQVWGSIGDIPEAAYAAQKVILTAEEIVEPDVLRRDPNRTVILGRVVDAVVYLPWAAHPSYAQGYYARDNRYYRDWAEVSGSTDRLDGWIRDEAEADGDHAAYVARHRGRLDELASIGTAETGSVNFGSNAVTAGVQE